MKPYKPNTDDTMKKALLARKVAAGRLSRARQSRRGALYGLRKNPFFRMSAYLRKLRGSPAHDSIPSPLDTIWSCVGSFIGILILVRIDMLFFSGDQLLLLGSFGASSLIIFGAPHSDFAQPRNVVGGQIISAAAGTLVYALAGDQLTLAAPLSVALAFGAMRATKTMHPPGGATALTAGSGQHVAVQMGVLYPLMPVGAGVFLLFLLGMLFNNLSRHRQYPLRWF